MKKLYILFLTIILLIPKNGYTANYVDSLGDVYNLKTDSRFVTTDFLVLEFLMALGHPPVGAGDLDDYEDRVSVPEKLPKSIADIGQSYTPNLELLQSLNPDFFIVEKSYTSKDIDTYKRIVNTIVVHFFGFKEKYLDNIFHEFQKFAKSLNKEDIAQEVAEKYEKTLSSTAALIKDKKLKKALYIQIWPDEHGDLSIRMHSNNYFFAELMNKSGLKVINNPKNIEKPSEWGFHTYTVQEFNTVDLTNTTLFISVNDQKKVLRFRKKKVALGISDKKKVLRLVKKNLILNAIFKKYNLDPYVMESAWPWGGPLSAIRFLENIQNCIKNNNHLSV